MRMTIRADAIRQPGPYMWVQLAESPLGLGPLYVRNPCKRKGKVEIPRQTSGNLSRSILEWVGFITNRALGRKWSKKKKVLNRPSCESL